MLENCLCLPRHSRCPGQLQPGSEDQRIPRLPKKADPMQQIIPPTAQSFTGDTCPGGTPPLSPSLSGWNPVNPPPVYPEKVGSMSNGVQAHTTWRKHHLPPALSPGLAASVSPHQGAPLQKEAPLPRTPGLGETLQIPRSSSATVALPAGCGLLRASTA